jgi:adenine-specific DNA glycosylase
VCVNATIFINFIKRYGTQTNRTVSKAAYRMVPSSYKIFKEAAGRLLDHRYPGIFNQAMMELGATICKPGKPECKRCPVCSLCHANHKFIHLLD